MKHAASLLFLHFVLCGVHVFASDIHELEKQLTSEYEGKTLVLRHFYHGDRLRFHSDGSLIGDAKIGPWTVDGQLSVQEVSIRGDRLQINGRRIYVIFNSQGKPVDYRTTLHPGTHDKSVKDIAEMLAGFSCQIDIELPSGSINQQDVDAAMHSVFLLAGESTADMMPIYWKSYVAKLENRPVQMPSSEVPVYYVKPGSGISPPRAKYSPDPDYSEAARKAKYQGIVVLYLIADQTGGVRDLQVVKPLGVGLDEEAVESVSKWKFEPAKKDGQPVAVVLNVEVQFRLY